MHKQRMRALKRLALNYVTRIGFKPMTYCLEGSCSIQLSYRAFFRTGRKYTTSQRIGKEELYLYILTFSSGGTEHCNFF